MKKKNKKISKKEMNIKDFITLALPNIIIVVFVLFCVIAGLSLQFDKGSASAEFLEIAGDMIADGSVIMVIACILLLPITILFFTIFYIMTLFSIPIGFFLYGFAFDNLIFWLFEISLVLLIFGAIRIRLGTWAEDYSYVSGVRYEISIDSNGKGTTKQSNIYSGDDGIFKNICLFLLRYIVVAIGGTVIFARRVKGRYAQ